MAIVTPERLGESTADRGKARRQITVGVDENGLGPRLGPLVVTAITAATDEAGTKRAESRPRGALRERLDDSKKLVAFGDTALGEAWARAIAARLGRAAKNPDELVHGISLDARDALRRPCPSEHAQQCWNTLGEEFVASDGLVETVGRDLSKLAKQGIEVSDAQVAIVCTDRLNTAVSEGRSRFDVDLHTMERLVLAARERSGCEVVATCGKVGGFDRYSPSFGPLSGRLHTVLDEGRARSEYVFPGVGRIAFVRDADARHLLVCMASLVGKWVRDLLMARIVRYHRDVDPELPLASGYHDPVTAKFVRATALVRRKRKLPDRCFERRALGKSANA